MRSKHFEKIYKDVPATQKEELLNFRASHPYKRLSVDGVEWEYIVCGQGTENLVLLVGGLRYADAAFRMITTLEDDYRLIVPTYPPLMKIEPILKGIVSILEFEGIETTYMLGASFGGGVAQLFVRAYPEKVEKVIFANTGGSFSDEYTERISKAARMVSLMPMSLMRILFKRRLLAKVDYFPESKRAFMRAFFSEIIARETKAEFLSLYRCLLDIADIYEPKQEDLADWSGKILIIESDDDAAIPKPMRESLKALYPQARVHTFHGGGHMPAMTQREEYVDLVKSFLSA